MDEKSCESGQEHKHALSRRQLLKALVAAGGAVAVSTVVPSKWTEPVVEVGVLPVHAQVSVGAPTPEPTIYAINCDSAPGGGDITTQINDVAVTVMLMSGSGPLNGVDVTVTCDTLPDSAFSPDLSTLSATTNDSGRASFGTVGVSAAPDTEFSLLFSATDPVNGTPLNCQCGVYRILAT